MKPLKKFEEFLKENIVRERSPNLFRSNSLIKEAERRNKFINNMIKKMGISDENANYFIENSYDAMIELIRAKLLANGFSSTGLGAHEAEVSYMRNLKFSEEDTKFMNDLRYFRNGIKYYGERFDKDYAEKVLTFLRKTYPALKKLNKK